MLLAKQIRRKIEISAGIAIYYINNAFEDPTVGCKLRHQGCGNDVGFCY